jgi:hypothetical protein
MKRYIVHHPQNFESREYRYYNQIFNGIIKKLEQHFDVLHTGYYKYANQGYSPVLLLSDNSTNQAPNIQMLECEMVIEDADTKEIKALSVSDSLTSVILGLAQNPHTTKILVAQYNHEEINHHLNSKESNSIYSPWVYFPQNIENYENYYNRRQNILAEGQLQDKFYFRGTSLEYRNIVSYFDRTVFTGGLPLGGFEAYANDLLQHKVGYSIAGRGEFCYRDVEYMAMGVPFIRFEYTNQMYPKLIPNYHYISVDRPADLQYDKDATPEHARLIEQKFLEVKDNTPYLNFIAKNAREFYKNYIETEKCIEHTLQLLNIHI